MKSFTYTELDELVGEILPERAVLSTLLVGGGEDDNENENTNLNLGGGHGHGGGGDDDGTTIVQQSCVSKVDNQNAGLLSALGLASQNPNVDHSCLPGTAIHSDH
ncbi:hypothetical protein [Spirillospora sp. NPDC048824]